MCLVRTAFIGLRASYNWMQIVTADVAILLDRLKIFAPPCCDICRKGEWIRKVPKAHFMHQDPCGS